MRTTLLLTIVVLGVVPAARAQQSCDSMTGVRLANTTVTSATPVAEGPFAGPAGPGRCRTAGDRARTLRRQGRDSAHARF